MGKRSGDGWYLFDGAIAHTAIWTRVLSSGEAADLTNNPYSMESGTPAFSNNAILYYNTSASKWKQTLSPTLQTVRATSGFTTDGSVIWSTLGNYTPGAPTASGYVTVTIGSTEYQLLAYTA
jgi:hypothetical protein